MTVSGNVEPDGPNPCAPAVPGALKFGPPGEFYRELRRRVERYFRDSGRRPRDCPRMYLKSALVIGWLVASYGLLVGLGGPWWLAVPLAVSLGLAMAAVGFNVQHDGNHRAYSGRRWVNRLAALSLDLLGASSYVWTRKHNSIHHSYTNITGHDDDIDMGLLGRLSPHQRRRWFHRFQHYYVWVLYGLLPAKWQLVDDFWAVAVGRVGGYRLARPRGWDLVTFVAGKATFLGLAFALPLWLYPAWAVLALFAVVSFTAGVVLSVVFQLAHCVEGAGFPLPEADTGRMAAAWAVHQVETTADFARGNRLLSWLVGGLNFQVEHHLFPEVCHVHYPALARLVEEACHEFGVRYAAHGSLRAAVASHFRWLQRLGQAGGVCPAVG